MTQRFQNITITEETVGSIASAGTHQTPSYYYTVDQAPTDWEQPISWNDFHKMFEPVFKDATKKIIAMFSENQKSLEDFLSIQNANSYSNSGGTIYGNVTVGNDLTIRGDVRMDQQLWRKYDDVYYPVGHTHVGMVCPFAGTATVPNGGWLVCNGTAYLATDYPNLYSVIGNTYDTHCGAASPGTGYFRVPNYQGRILVGQNPSDSDFDSLTDYGGEKTHTLTTGEMPSHNHSIGGNVQGFVGYHDHLLTGSDIATAPDGGTTVFSLSTGYTGSGSAHNNLQPYAVVNYIIKY